MKNCINVAIIDSHPVVRNGIRNTLNQIGVVIVFESDRTEMLLKAVETCRVDLDICIIDTNNCGKFGVESIRLINQCNPNVRIIVFTEFFHEHSLVRLIRDGANCCIPKCSQCSELCKAVLEVFDIGYYFSMQEIATMTLEKKNQQLLAKFLSDNEITFLKLVCSELTYKEIAGIMHASIHTIESCRDDLFARLRVRSRVGLVLFAIKNGILRIEA